MEDVVVAGSGVTGLAVALALARRGAKVRVCDPAPLGDNASGVAAGMLAPAFEAVLDPLSAGHFELLKAARDLWPGFAPVEIARDGAVFVSDGLEVRNCSWTYDLSERSVEATAETTGRCVATVATSRTSVE